MEKQQKAGPQIYGYSVCLVAVITFLISTSTLVDAVMQRQDPLHSGFSPAGAPSLASFEIYKMDILRSSQGGEGTNKASYIPDDNTLRAMFEASKSDKIQKVMHNSNSSIIITGLMILICTVLFVTHWRWLKNMNKPEGVPA
jgi:hypothetical protein